MKTFSLVLLRVSVGLLILYWGLDKIVNVEHAVSVSDGFYLGLFSIPLLLQVWGGFQTLVGLFTVLGLYRIVAYPLVIAMNTVSLLGVWRSIVDPWGWFLEGSNVLFFPSLAIFAASLLLWATRDEDSLALDRRRGT
ncbi:MAG: hypothetical protein WD960_13905 [Gemmatimonadota bacterium]